MLLDNNTKRVMSLVEMVDNLKGIDKVRLGIHLFKDLGFILNYDIRNIINLLNNILEKLDPDSKTTITNFSKYQNLIFISSKYMELSTQEKERFSVEVLFNIFQYNFNDKRINKMAIQLNVYEYYYSLIYSKSENMF